jgi:hypothetical protein
MSTKDGKASCACFGIFFVLFIGISTASNLSRTRREPVQSRGFFLFRKRRTDNLDISREDDANDHRDSSQPRR